MLATIPGLSLPTTVNIYQLFPIPTSLWPYKINNAFVTIYAKQK
jgi:hypothetical protein